MSAQQTIVLNDQLKKLQHSAEGALLPAQLTGQGHVMARLNEEEARLLYVATTRARKLLVVPSRLAEKWNGPPVSVSPTASASRVSPQSAKRETETKPRPDLPSFAKVISPPSFVTTKSAALPSSTNDRPTTQRAREVSIAPAPPVVQSPYVADVVPVPTAQNGLLTTIFRILMGKK